MLKIFESLVPTLDQCKALHPYWGQSKTVFSWVYFPDDEDPFTHEFLPAHWALGAFAESLREQSPEWYPAPTMQELWKELPDALLHNGIEYEKLLTKYCVTYDNPYDEPGADLILKTEIQDDNILHYMAELYLKTKN